MNEIKCPNCGKMFQIDEKDYDSIVKQIRNHEFEEEIKRRENEFSKEKKNELELLKQSLTLENNGLLSDKDKVIEKLKNDLDKKELEVSSKFDKELVNKDKEIEKLRNDLDKKELEISSKFDKEIQKLKSDLKQKESEYKLELKDTVQEKENEINNLNNKLELNEKEFQLKEQSLKESYEDKLKGKDQEIELYKEMKLKLSTKMIGESLEQHCNTEYNNYLRTILTRAYFEKDNDVKTGSKGDFIFRDYSEDGIEYISIMFEMKNESDKTATKHKNEDFFKELDKDRREKNCEYAVLVSLLEKDNDIYNTGIVDVSHKFEKMYVIRPQAFIPIINILRGAALKTLEAKRRLIEIQNQNIDISHFEENMNNFKEAFGKNFRLASEKFNTAIEEIDKSIDHLQKIKTNLLSSENNLRLANNKADDLSIRKLTVNAPSIAEKFEKIGVEVKKNKTKK